MASPCSKCGSFLRADGGCTRCERSSLLAHKPKTIPVNTACNVVLSKPVEIRRGRSKYVFQRNVFVNGHLKRDHSKADFNRRMANILYCIDAVKSGNPIHQEVNRNGKIIKRVIFKKNFQIGNKTLLAAAVAGRSGKIRQIFTFYMN